jgi:hypothetical protein
MCVKKLASTDVALPKAPRLRMPVEEKVKLFPEVTTGTNDRFWRVGKLPASPQAAPRSYDQYSSVIPTIRQYPVGSETHRFCTSESKETLL